MSTSPGFPFSKPVTPLGTSLESTAGPFFLGYAFESMGMGVVLILSINYYLSVISRPRSPSESSRRLGVILVRLSLIINASQTVVDLFRGWNMFAVNFMDLTGFIRPTPLFFLSPFLGLLPAIITQAFLLRRSILFISSLSVFWPRLAHPISRWAFGLFMAGAILVSAVGGITASVYVWKSTALFDLAVQSDVVSPFQRAELTWLVTSSGIDIILSFVLCIELWWARRKLSASGGVMRSIVTKLMLVTFNGGLAVSTIQIVTLMLYQFARRSSWCYFPMLSLGKIYNITLILSLSLPHAQGSGPGPSQVFSLPTIASHMRPTSANARNSLPTSPPATRDMGLPEGLHTEINKTPDALRNQSRGSNKRASHSHRGYDRHDDKEIREIDEKKSRRKSIGKHLSLVVERGWRISQDWIGWSLVSMPRAHRGSGEQFGRQPVQQGKKIIDEPEGGERHIPMEGRDMGDMARGPIDESPPFARRDYRRPSEPSSIAPLLGLQNSLLDGSFSSPRTPFSPPLHSGRSSIPTWAASNSAVSPLRSPHIPATSNPPRQADGAYLQPGFSSGSTPFSPSSVRDLTTAISPPALTHARDDTYVYQYPRRDSLIRGSSLGSSNRIPDVPLFANTDPFGSIGSSHRPWNPSTDSFMSSAAASLGQGHGSSVDILGGIGAPRASQRPPLSVVPSVSFLNPASGPHGGADRSLQRHDEGHDPAGRAGDAEDDGEAGEERLTEGRTTRMMSFTDMLDGSELQSDDEKTKAKYLRRGH